MLWLGRCATTVLLFAASASAQALEWPQFRGPEGRATAADQRLPDEFGPDRNVFWKQETPEGHSSPIVWGDRIFLTGSEGATLSVLAYSRRDGALLWKRDFASAGEEQLRHRDATPAAPTPCTDGERVHAYFGGYGLVTLDMEGQLLWEHRFPVESSAFGTGSSPILDGGSLYLVRDTPTFSAVHAFDAVTGEERWTTPRPEASLNYSTPFLWRHRDRTELVVAGSTVVKSYDGASGEVLWWVNGQTVFVCPTPTASKDVLYFGGWSTPNAATEDRLAAGFPPEAGLTPEILADPPRFVAHLDRNGDGRLQVEELPEGRAKDAFAYLDSDRSGTWDLEEIERTAESYRSAPGRNVLVAIRAGGRGDITDTHVMWEKTKGLPYVASPLLHDGRLYYVKKGGYVSSVDADTGEPFFEAARLGVGGEYYASPVGVGDRVLVGASRGTMFVLATGDELEIVARNEFDEGIYATPAVVDNTMYLRTARHLWAIGDARAAASEPRPALPDVAAGP
jgi:outer membrane protein assembly factor BamB